MPPVRRVALLLLPALLWGAGAAAAFVLLGPAAPAAAAARCVGVVVDARLAGGSLHSRCAKGDPDSGLDALARAGVGYAFVPRQPGQVCQLDGVPACSDTGTDTYWSYWWRAKGSTRWVYATTGAAAHDPAPGDTEAWVWQDGGRRKPPDLTFASICPSAAGARSGSPAPARSSSPARSREAEPLPDPTSTPKASRPAATSSSKPSSSKASTSTASSSPVSGSTAPPTTSTPGTTSTTSTSAGDPSAAATDGSGPEGSDGSDGSGDGAPWAGAAVGAALVALLGGATVLRSRRSAR